MLGRKRRTGTKQTKKITILNDVSSLFVLSQCVYRVPKWRFLHHVTVSCKGHINCNFTRSLIHWGVRNAGFCLRKRQVQMPLGKLAKLVFDNPKLNSRLGLCFVRGPENEVHNQMATQLIYWNIFTPTFSRTLCQSLALT